MAGVFISYRREDTSGEASHLAADIGDALGQRDVFIDIDTIGPGVDYVKRIDSALTSCELVLVLIGDRWLSVTDSSGKRRLDNEDDFVVMEVSKALERSDVTVVPVLVEGATMPTEAELPPRIAGLARRNALELASKRWRYDLEQILALIKRGPRAKLRRIPTWARVVIPLALAVGVLAVLLVSSGGGGGSGVSTTPVNPKRPILAPATVAPVIDICEQPVQRAVDGTDGPIKCDDGGLNKVVWDTYAKANPLTFSAGPNATPTQVQNAMCADLDGAGGTIPRTDWLYQIAQVYYGWDFALPPEAASC
jgi:hypothetical protein